MFKIVLHDDLEAEIMSLPMELQGKTVDLIEKLQTIGQLRMPHSKSLGGGLFEIRVIERNNIARTLYAYQHSKTIFLLHAFVKKTNKTPANALKIARTRLQEMIENDNY